MSALCIHCRKPCKKEDGYRTERYELRSGMLDAAVFLHNTCPTPPGAIVTFQRFHGKPPVKPIPVTPLIEPTLNLEALFS